MTGQGRDRRAAPGTDDGSGFDDALAIANEGRRPHSSPRSDTAPSDTPGRVGAPDGHRDPWDPWEHVNGDSAKERDGTPQPGAPGARPDERLADCPADRPGDPGDRSGERRAGHPTGRPGDRSAGGPGDRRCDTAQAHQDQAAGPARPARRGVDSATAHIDRQGASAPAVPDTHPGAVRAAGPVGTAGAARSSGAEGPREPVGAPSAPGAPGAPGGSGGSGGPGVRRRAAVSWNEARAIAVRAVRRPLESGARGLGDALGQVLAEPLAALTDLPSFDSSAMDGWAVAGPGPWRLTDGPSGGTGAGILAGQQGAVPLEDGTAVPIATGARVPPGATAVLRSEHGEVRQGRGVTEPTGGGAWLHASGRRTTAPGQDIRPRGQECRSGDRLLGAGTVVTPAVLGLAAAAGYDALRTVRRPRVEVLVLGDELLHHGLPRDGRIRDALGPMLGPWLRALGAEVTGTRRLGDDAELLYSAVSGSTADLVVTTGGTASGPVDHVHPVLRRLGAEVLVDGVAVRPGHPMLLARPAPDRYLVGLPGNPLAAVSGLLTLVEPLLRALSGRGECFPARAPLAEGAQGHPHDTRLVPVGYRARAHSASAGPGAAGRAYGTASYDKASYDTDPEGPAPYAAPCAAAGGPVAEWAVPLRFNGPAMLRGVAAADGLAVVPPGGAEAGAMAEILELPWFEGEIE